LSCATKHLYPIALWPGMFMVLATLVGCTTPATPVSDTITASGTIDAETVAITSQYGGRVQEVRVDEGDPVVRDTVLIGLDTALIDVQIQEAEAAVLAAEAELDGVKAGARAEEIHVAEAALAQAQAQRDGAQRAWENARTIKDNPQDLTDHIDQARTQVNVASQAVEQAEAQLHATQVQRDSYDNPSAEYIIAQGQVEVAQAGLEQARAQYAGAQKTLANLLAVEDNPIEMEAEVHAAEAARHEADASIAAAQAELDLLRAGPTTADVSTAEANLRQVLAALEALQVQREKMTLLSPVAGLVSSRAIEPGEIAGSGATLLSLADLDRVKLTVFVPETQVAKVNLGQPVEVAVDAYPARTFMGNVTFIAHEAEFTPRNVQMEDQRANLVFAVRVSLENPEHLLKPGMPAEATLSLDQR
jgi:HlyD family secretion protein